MSNIESDLRPDRYEIEVAVTITTLNKYGKPITECGGISFTRDIRGATRFQQIAYILNYLDGMPTRADQIPAETQTHPYPGHP